MKLSYVLPVVLLVLLALAIWWYLASARKQRDERARAEAQAPRESAAARVAPTMAGQQAFAQQAEQRHAEQAQEAARIEAERQAAEERAAQAAREAAEAQRRADDAAREAQAAEVRVEAASAAVGEAGHEVRDAHQRLEQTRAEYAADLHRADVVDPDTDVTEKDPVPALSADDERARALAMGAGFQDEVSERDVAAAAGPAVVTAQPDETRDAEIRREQADRAGSPVVSDGTMPDDEAVTADAPLRVDEAQVEAEVTRVESPGDEPTGEDTWTDADADGLATEHETAEHEATEHETAEHVTTEHETTEHETTEAEVMPSDAPETEAWGRRISSIEEIRDGGYGMGSAAPIGDGAQPLAHPVQAYRDTMTFRTEDMPGYDSCEPDVWFYDADAAARAGFSPAQDG